MFLSFPLAKESGASQCIQLTGVRHRMLTWSALSPSEGYTAKAQGRHLSSAVPKCDGQSVPLSLRRDSFNQRIVTMTNCSAANSHARSYKTMAKQCVGLKLSSVFNLLKPTF